MRCQIVLNNGEVIGLDMSWSEILSGPGKLGEIRLDAGPGVLRIVPKGSIVQIVQFTDDAWTKVKDDAEKQRDEQAKAQADAEAKTNTSTELRKADADAATLALLEGKTIKGRVKRFLGVKP